MRESRRVEGGSVYSVHVLFVNRPTGKGTLGSIAASPPRDTKQGPVGGGGRVRGNSICACMYGDSVLERWRPYLLALSMDDEGEGAEERGRRKREGILRTKGGVGEDAFS